MAFDVLVGGRAQTVNLNKWHISFCIAFTLRAAYRYETHKNTLLYLHLTRWMDVVALSHTFLNHHAMIAAAFFGSRDSVWNVVKVMWILPYFSINKIWIYCKTHFQRCANYEYVAHNSCVIVFLARKSRECCFRRDIWCIFKYKICCYSAEQESNAFDSSFLGIVGKFPH